VYDASVKIPSGLITGNYRILGNFDECLRVKSNEHGFIGQACNVGVQFYIQPDNDTSRELDLADLFRNIAIASVSGTFFGKLLQRIINVEIKFIKIHDRIDSNIRYTFAARESRRNCSR
jgi:hypothetical protein